MIVSTQDGNAQQYIDSRPDKRGKTMGNWRLDDIKDEGLKRQIIAALRDTDKAPNMERDTVNAPAGTDADKEAHPKVDIRVHSVRKRRTDCDAICAKWVVDSIAESGFIRDDSPDFVASVTFSQEKGSPERTIVTITEASDK